MLNDLFAECHARSKEAGWWVDPITGEVLSSPKFAYFPYIIATKIALIHSEVSEALEGFRTDATDDKLTHRESIEVELADAVIRIGDLAACLGLDVAGAIKEKFGVNAVRTDHSIANRRKPGGKKF